jgi:single-stranded-DNA-specific exonuclease
MTVCGIGTCEHRRIFAGCARTPCARFALVQQLSLTGKRWRFIDGARELPADPLAIGAALASRRTLRDDGGDPYDPSVFADSAKAAERVRKAITDKEKIAVFGDYDCDGITGSAQVLRALKRHGTSALPILPNRMAEGYGLKPWAIERCAERGITLLIAVDNGILAHEAIALAAERGIDTIILDHHALPSPDADGSLTLPPAYAILHPALSDGFRAAHPAAAGVALLFVHALEGSTWSGRDTDLALAAIGTIADVVPLLGFNRTVVRDGLAAIRRGSIDPPLLALLSSVRSGDAPLTSGDIAFRVAPRINAAGRLADPQLALTTVLEGGDTLGELERLNALRQDETQRSIDRAFSVIRPAEHLFLCIADAEFQPGIVGLVAGRLTEQFGRPSIVASVRSGICTASLRSIPGYDVTSALSRCADLLTTYGGHAQAAGCSLPFSQWEELSRRLNADLAERLQPDELLPTILLDAEISHASVRLQLCESLLTLEPFGHHNQRPVFLLSGMTLSNTRLVGGDGKHLQCTIGNIKAIGFGLGHVLKDAGGQVDIACSLEIDRWNGFARPQAVIKDIRPAL